MVLMQTKQVFKFLLNVNVSCMNQVCTSRWDTHTLNPEEPYRAVLCRTTKRVVMEAVSKSAGLSWKD